MPAEHGGLVGRALPSLTIAIASHQRREELERLLRTLAAEIAGQPTLRPGLEVVVVLDGSTDGSAEMVEALDMPVPLRAVRRAHAGLAAARNAGLAAARGELVWFLDDDLVPSSGLLAIHRRVERPVDRRIIVGPCDLPVDHRVHPRVRAFWAERHRQLAAAGRVERFDQFSAANTSGPVSVFDAVGAFDAGFVGYGAEDYELAHRLLARGEEIAYVADAVAWHRPPHGVLDVCRRMRSEGRNQVRLAAGHPEAFEVLFPPAPDLTWPYRLIRALRLQRYPRLLDALSTALLPLVAAEAALTRQRSDHLLGAASAARFAASVARHDPDGRFTARILGLDDPQP